jgi:Uma2 family endonuclease
VERNLGEIDHGDLQPAIVAYLRSKYTGMWSAVEVRVQVRATRFRVPDVVIVQGPRPRGRIITTVPHLVIEVLSPDDRAGDVQEKIDDYLAFGVPCIWVIDPRTRRGYMYTSEGMREAKDGLMRTQEIVVPLAELFD